MKKLILSSLICLLSWPVYAEPIIEIDNIVVTAEKLQGAVPVAGDGSESVEVPYSGTVQDSPVDYLEQAAGVHIRRFGGLEQSTSISIRGSSASQVQIFLDDIPLQTTSGQGLDLNQFEISQFSKIRVFKNYSPANLGGQAVGGGVQLQTKGIEPGFHHRYGLGFGSFQTYDLLLEQSLGEKTHQILWGLDYKRTKGNFKYLDDNGTPLNTADDQTVSRQNNNKRVIHPYFKWIHELDSKTKLKLQTHFFHVDQGVPGLSSFQSTSANLTQKEFLMGLTVTRQSKLKNHSYLRLIQSQFSDPLGEIGVGAAQDNDNKTMVVGNRFTYNVPITSALKNTFGFEAQSEWFLPKDYAAANDVGSSSKRTQLNLFSEPQLKLFEDKLLWSVHAQSLNSFYSINNNDPSLSRPGTFFESQNQYDWSLSTLMSYQINKEFSAKASVGRFVRFPYFYELFGDNGNTVGNPQLDNEHSIKWDAGLVYQKPKLAFLKKFKAQLDYFESYYDDLIQFEVVSGFARASNIGKAKVQGLELSVQSRLLKYFQISSGYTYQRPKNKGQFSGNDLVGRPRHELNSQVSFLYKGLKLSTNINWIDHQALDSLNTQVVKNRLIANATASYLFKDHYRVSFEARNLNNSQVVDAVGFPLPGRSFFGRVDLEY